MTESTADVADLAKRLRRAERMERRADRYAVEKDAEIAEAEALVAAREAEIARLRAALARKDVEIRELKDAATVPCPNPAGVLRNAARGRRTYLEGLAGEPSMAEVQKALELEIATIERCAQVVDGDDRPLFAGLPSRQWTDEMNDSLRG